jgi:hypothetical protein
MEILAVNTALWNVSMCNQQIMQEIFLILEGQIASAKGNGF